MRWRSETNVEEKELIVRWGFLTQDRVVTWYQLRVAF